MKKILIITYYWPPSSGSGVQRWLKFSKYLIDYGWKPIIVTPQNPYKALHDNGLEKNISNKIDVIKFPIWEPYRLKDNLFGKSKKFQTSGIFLNRKSLKNKLLNWVRGNLFIPDPKKYWVKPTTSNLKSIIDEQKIEYIISTGPPHSMHLIALNLKSIYKNIKWIADFRDPWSHLDILKEFKLTRSSFRKHKILENNVIKNANIVLTVSESWANDFIKLGAKNVEIIRNGFDEEDFINFKPRATKKFIIGHFGVMNHLRNPSKLWESLNELCDDNIEFAEKLEIRLSGNVEDKILDEIRSYPNLKSKLVVLGFLEHSDVIKEYSIVNLFILLLFNSKSGQGNYPGKLFEYLATKKPIISFGPESSDVKNFFSNGFGFYNSYLTDVQIIKKNILDIFTNNFEKRNFDTSIYSRKFLTQRLVKLIEKL